MVERRRLLMTAGGALFGGVAGCTERDAETPAALRFSFPEFEGGTVPVANTCDGAGVSPRVEIDTVPPPTESLALTATFPNDVANQVTLWTLWNIPPDTKEIPSDVPATATVDTLGDARQGRNARGDLGYLSVCPPPGQPYTHWFTLYACRRELPLEPGSSRDALAEELETATLASRLVRADYERRSSTNTTSS